jgi:hypothetical protein
MPRSYLGTKTDAFPSGVCAFPSLSAFHSDIHSVVSVLSDEIIVFGRMRYAPTCYPHCNIAHEKGGSYASIKLIGNNGKLSESDYVTRIERLNEECLKWYDE